MITWRIIPLNKKPNEIPDSIKDLRNIATRHVIQILLENIVKPELQRLTQDDRFVSQLEQMDSKKGGNVHINLIRIIIEIMRLQELNAKHFILFFDIEKAFDNVNHEILFKILEKIDIKKKFKYNYIAFKSF